MSGRRELSLGQYQLDKCSGGEKYMKDTHSPRFTRHPSHLDGRGFA